MFKNFKKIKSIQNLYRLYLRSKLRRFILAKPLLFLLRLISGLEIVTREDMSKEKDKCKIFSYSCEEVVNYREPYTFSSMPNNFSEIIFSGTLKFDKPLIFEITDAEISGLSPLGFDRDGAIILETTPHPSSSLKDQIEHNIPLLSLLIKYLPSVKSNKLDAVCCLLITTWTNNYWHWLIDVMLRIEGLEFYEKQTGIKPQLIVPKNMSAWQRDSLEILGYSPNNWIIWDKLKIKVNKLVVPSFRRYYDGQKYNRPMSSNACHWLRNRIFNNISNIDMVNQSFSVNIFISRRKAFSRRVINEDEVIKALALLGFATYILEEMSFVEQVRLFSQAQIIISPHGAGLANLIFSDNPLVIELFSSCILPGNANLARGLGFKYGCLRGRYPPGELRESDGDMLVSTEELLNLLAKMQAN